MVWTQFPKSMQIRRIVPDGAKRKLRNQTLFRRPEGNGLRLARPFLISDILNELDLVFALSQVELMGGLVRSSRIFSNMKFVGPIGACSTRKFHWLLSFMIND